MRRQGGGKAREQKKKTQMTRVRAALLRLFRGQHNEKCLLWGEFGVSGTREKARSHFGSIQQGRSPHHHIEAVIDWCSCNLIRL